MNPERKHIYADNAATTRLSQNALKAMLPYLSEEYANASQPYVFARNPKKALRDARAALADSIGALPEEIYFTSCGTESNNWVIRGAIQKRLPIITSSIEHHSVLRPCLLSKKTTYLPVSDEGLVISSFAEKNLVDSSGLVSIMFANNEIGTIEPIQELVEMAHQNGWLFHTDAVQAVGHFPVDAHELGVDMLSASAHKFNGPKGVGFLYIKRGIDWPSFLLGGSQEYGHRAGTENVASIVGMAVALQENVSSLKYNLEQVKSLENLLLGGLNDAGITFRHNGAVEHIAGNISLSFPDKEGEMLLHRLDLNGISVSTGSACDSKNTQISHVLKAINLEERYAKGTIRISLSQHNTESEVFAIVEALTMIMRE